jgi:adenylosuccinate synthase
VGAGVGPKSIDEVWGVAKAYSTRVGEGPFPTELHDDIGRHMLERGHEYGTTTGRQRRCGWIDLVGLRYAARINGLTGLVITKLDVLAGVDPLRVCTSYRNDEGAVFEDFPYHQSILHNATAVTETVRGFDEEIGGCRTLSELPAAARDYLELIADSVGVPVKLVGVGPGRDQVIWADGAQSLRAVA